MFLRLLALVSVAASAAVAAPVPKGLKASNKFDTARFKPFYKDASFEKVLEDFADGTGLEWVGERPVLTNVSLNPKKDYSGAEFLDLINDLLEFRSEPRQYVLIRHAKTFYLHPADQPVDPEKVDTVTAEDILLPRRVPAERGGGGPWGGGRWENGQWVSAEQDAHAKRIPPKRGKTETATLVLDLKGQPLRDTAPQLKKSLSATGRMELSERGDAVRITDRVDNLNIIARIATESVK